MLDKNITNHNKIFLILSFGVILLSLLGMILNYQFQKLSIQNNAEYNVTKYNKDFDENIKHEANSLHSFLNLLDNSVLIDSYLSSNREDLYKIAKPLFDNLNKHSDLTHFYFIKPNDEVFLRVHDLKKHSDSINRFTYLKAKTLQEPFYGLEFGINNTFTLRLVYPWIVNNELIGYIELGKEVDKITANLSEKMDLKIFFAINSKEFNGSSPNEEKYIIYKTTNIDKSISDFIESNNKTKSLTFNNNNYIGFKYPLNDISDKNLGFKIVLVNLTNEYNQQIKQSIHYGLIMAFGTILMLLVGYYFSKFKQKQITDTINKLENDKTEIESLLNDQESLLQLFNIGDSILFRWNNDKNWSINYVSNNVENLLGYTKEDFFKKRITYSDCIFPDDFNRVINEVNIESNRANNFFKHEPYRIIDKNGNIKWVLDYTVFSKDNEDNIIYFLGYIIDITEQKMIHENLKKLIDLQNNIIILTDGSELNYANKQFFNFFRYSNLKDFKKEHQCVCEFFIEDDRYFHLGKIDKIQNWIEEIQKIPENKSIVAMKDKYSIIHIFSVHINNFEKDLSIISFTDISETMIEQQKLEKKVTLDKLTNTYNREYFENNIEIILNNNDINNLKTAIVIFDIDYFKKVNDTFGHDIGDEVLKEFVKIIKSISRFSDDILIRWGGEEFLMILSIKNQESLFKILEKYRESIADNNFQYVGKITCSIGASIHNNLKDITNTIKEADIALYKAKNSGRNKVILH